MRRLGRIISLVLSLTMLVGASMVPRAQSASAGHPFSDIRGSTYEQTIEAVWELGVVSGMEPDKFVPGGPVTRAQMAALIIRAMGKSSEAELAKSVASEFSDVPDGHWARGVITLANRAGIIKGDAGRFYPNDPVNYAQAATMLVRALGYEGQVSGGYPSGYVLKANELKLLTNVSFDLYGGVNRAEAAVMLYNAIFRAPAAASQLTWSQTMFKRATSLTMDALPTYVAPGQKLTLVGHALDREGNQISDVAITYEVVSGQGEISGNTLTAGDGGPISLRASLNGLTAVASVSAVSDLAITPATFQANKGGTVQLQATALSGGQRVTVSPEWKVKQGPASVSNQGLLSVTDYGGVTVQATLGNLTATATGQAVGKVTITAKPEYLVPGLTYTFAAITTDSTGQPISVPVTWSAVGATIDRTTGQLSNPGGNNVVVRATAAGMTDEVSIPVIKSIMVYPTTSAVLIGHSVAFSAKVVDSTGRQYTTDVRWDRSSPTIGIIDRNGQFAGINSGTTDVTAEVGSLKGKATVSVSGPPTRLSVTAGSTALPVGTGASTEITVKLLDQPGNLSPVTDQPVTFTLSDNGRGTLSRTVVLTQAGEAKVTYTTGGTAGTATIVASVPGTTLAAQSLVISSYQPVPSYVQLTATPQPLATGGGVATITATLRDSNNFPASTTQNLYVSLGASGTQTGGLTGTTITIPAGQSTGTVSFISSSTPGTVQISGTSSYQVRPLTLTTTAVAAAAKVKIRPITTVTPVTGLSSLPVKVDVLDAADVMRANDNTTSVVLKVVMGGVGEAGFTREYTATATGGVATFQVPALAVGTATLTASLGGVASAPVDTTTAEFVPGIFSSLRLTAQPSSLPADGYSQTLLVAEVVDRSGMVLTTVNPVVTFRKLVDGNATTALTDLQVQAVGGKAVLSLQAGRLAGSDTWYASAPGLDTQNLATIATTATSGDAYTIRVNGSTSLAVNSGNTLIVQVVDQQGRLVTSDNGRTIAASHSLPGVTVAPSAALTQSGTATFVVTGTQATSGTITFSTTGLAVPVVQTSVTFGTSGSSANAYSLYASASTATPRVGNAVTVWVRVMDSQGQVLTADSNRIITAAISGNASLSSSTAVTVGGLATFTVTPNGTGQVSITFTASGLPQPTVSLPLTVTN